MKFDKFIWFGALTAVLEVDQTLKTTSHSYDRCCSGQRVSDQEEKILIKKKSQIVNCPGLNTEIPSADNIIGLLS